MKIKLLSLMFFYFSACGANFYKSYESSDPAEDATIALENDNADKAINILTEALEGDPGNTTYKSILALAYAQRAGIDPLTLAQKMGGSNSSQANSAASGNGLTSLFSIMPDATDDHISDVDKAVSLLVEIPSAERISADTLKLAMFQIASMTLRSKQLDTNGDGILSTEEILQLSLGSATAILSQLAAAAGVYGSSNSSSSTDQAVSSKITEIQSSIQSQPGATDQEKLQSYLAKTSS